MTIIYLLIYGIVCAALGYGIAYAEGFFGMKRSKRQAIEEQMRVQPKFVGRTTEDCYMIVDHIGEAENRGYNWAIVDIAEDIERGGNKVLAWQIRKRIKS